MKLQIICIKIEILSCNYPLCFIYFRDQVLRFAECWLHRQSKNEMGALFTSFSGQQDLAMAQILFTDQTDYFAVYLVSSNFSMNDSTLFCWAQYRAVQTNALLKISPELLRAFRAM